MHAVHIIYFKLYDENHQRLMIILHIPLHSIRELRNCLVMHDSYDLLQTFLVNFKFQSSFINKR